MTLQVNRKLFTVEEYHKLAEVGILKPSDRVELINGEIITMSPIKSNHAGTVASLVEFLIINLYKKASILSQSPVAISNKSEPEPDIIVAKYKSDTYRSGHPTSNDTYLIIEVSESTLVYDQSTKAEMYANAGIPEYWIINLIDRQIEIYRQPKNGEYHFKQIISEEQAVPAAAIDFSINYSDIFKEV